MGELKFGTVKWFDDRKGYGFITAEEGTDIFVHWSGIVSDQKFKKLKEGQSVRYLLSNNENGVIAVNVEVQDGEI